MGIRETLNQKPYIGLSVVSLAVLLALWYLFTQLQPSNPAGRQFYTDDDGKTFYSGVAGLPVPMEKNGKTVVMAEVFEVKGKQFVAYMRRYTPAALENIKKNGFSGTAEKGAASGSLRVEYKKPGDTKWHDIDGDVKAMSEYLKLSSSEGDLIQVEP